MWESSTEQENEEWMTLEYLCFVHSIYSELMSWHLDTMFHSSGFNVNAHAVDTLSLGKIEKKILKKHWTCPLLKALRVVRSSRCKPKTVFTIFFWSSVSKLIIHTVVKCFVTWNGTHFSTSSNRARGFFCSTGPFFMKMMHICPQNINLQ